MHRFFFIFVVMLIWSVGGIAQSPTYLQISKVKILGIDSYSTPYFELSPSQDQIRCKVIYQLSGHYVKNSFTLQFLFREDNSLLFFRLKRIIENTSNNKLSICLKANPESFQIHKDYVSSCLYKGWDDYEECPVIKIEIPLGGLVSKYDSYKKTIRHFKKMLSKSDFICLQIENNGVLLEIPIEIPLKDIFIEMERM